MIELHWAGASFFEAFVERCNAWGIVETTILDATTFVVRFEHQSGAPYVARITGTDFGDWLEDGEGAPIFPQTGTIEKIERSWNTEPGAYDFVPALDGLSIDVADLKPAVDDYDLDRLAVLAEVRDAPDLVLIERNDVYALDADWMDRARDYVARGLEGNDAITTGEGDDDVRGRKGDDSLVTRGGDDFVHGRKGNDYISAGDGDDVVRGGAGNDRLDAGAGLDDVRGGKGDDQLSDGEGAPGSILRGNEGDDLFSFYPGYSSSGAVQSGGEMRGGKGEDDLRGAAVMDGGRQADVLVSESGDQILRGGHGDDVFLFYKAAGQDEVLDFGDGDRLRLLAVKGFETAEDVLSYLTQTDEGVSLYLGRDGGTVLFRDAELADFTADRITVDVDDALVETGGPVQIGEYLPWAVPALTNGGVRLSIGAYGYEEAENTVYLERRLSGRDQEDGEFLVHTFTGRDFVFNEEGRLVGGVVDSVTADLWVVENEGALTYFDRPLGEEMIGLEIDIDAMRLDELAYSDLSAKHDQVLRDAFDVYDELV